MGCLSSFALPSLLCLALPLSCTEQVCATAKIQNLPDFTESSNAQQLTKWQSNSFLTENDTGMNRKTHLQYHFISYGHQLGATARAVLQKQSGHFHLYISIGELANVTISFLLFFFAYLTTVAWLRPARNITDGVKDLAYGLQTAYILKLSGSSPTASQFEWSLSGFGIRLPGLSRGEAWRCNSEPHSSSPGGLLTGNGGEGEGAKYASSPGAFLFPAGDPTPGQACTCSPCQHGIPPAPPHSL